MTTQHALADLRHAERYDLRPAFPAPSRAPARLAAARRSLGLLLVEAGLHVLTSADRRSAPLPS